MADRDKPPSKGKPGGDPGQRARPSQDSSFGDVPPRKAPGAPPRTASGTMKGVSGPLPLQRTATTGLPAVAGPGTSGPHANPLAGKPAAPAAPPAPPRAMTDYQKQILSSGFQDAERQRRLSSMLGNTGEKTDEGEEDDEPTSLGLKFDGDTPAPQLTGRDLWKAVQAPVQSREGRRSVEIYAAVLAQFAVGNNPRYEPDGAGKPRGHIFLWDVSRAMNCEVPHFVGAKELSLAQTVDWLRHEGPMRGWTRAGPDDAIYAAQQGMLAVALPRDIKQKQIAIVLPEDPDPANMKPRVAAAALKRGKRLGLAEALGVFAAEYFVHA